MKRYVTTGVRVFPREWKNGTVVNRLDAYELQRTLDQFVAHARKVINDLMERGELDMQRIVATPIGADNRREAKAKQSTFTVRCKRGEEPRFFDKWATFEGTSMYKLKKDADNKERRNGLLNHIKKAKEQADNMLLEMPHFVRKRNINRAIYGYLKQSKKERIILVCWKNKLLIYGHKTNVRPKGLTL